MKERDMPVYMIGVVAQILEVHPQTLRLYEREGLVTPSRQGNQRLYSQSDLERLRLIVSLSRQMGVNRAGVDIILRLRGRLEALQDQVEDMLGCIEEARRKEFEKRIRMIFHEEE